MNNDIGVIGLSVMGTNLALNMADNGYKVSVFNRTTSVVDEVASKYEKLTPTYSIESFVNSLKKPRAVFLMVKSGKPVDLLIEQLIEVLDEGDIIIDGGNSFYKDTIRRDKYLKEKGINFLGVGVSGGEEGARFGPAIMPGGDESSYGRVKDIFENISAKAYGEPCCKFVSKDGSGHYLKMIHNGIEYADMQMITEIYTLLKHVGKMDNDEIQKVFEEWNKGELESYLIEITAEILKVKTDEGVYLLDKILDTASQKGTGKWVNMEALELGIDVSVITAAINARFMSSIKSERIKASNIIDSNVNSVSIDKEALVELAKNSLYVAKIVAYAQGLKLMVEASKKYDWNIDLSELVKIFRGGCIIRARFLNDISKAFKDSGEVDNLIMTEFFYNEINSRLKDLRKLVSASVNEGIPVTAMSAALGYIDSYRTSDSGANLIQAQRDYFGAHTFEMTDKEGHFHYDWTGNNE
ncbi:NADP-dependent phosphogluconate dehydrogenase [Peptostreptococcus faecalis]|uniref:NADP-dependent phosphogluconate dehydrogenase n=1 Tax=Peptostreptococcus faecalis TaxID=2045015 RepID=UPI000C7DE78C|nr:NADP-dependent phosphogluconate dehydrogenase [Peptostreptococcus faecalis]